MPARVRSTEAEAKRWLGDAQAEEVARQAARDEKKAIKEARMQQRLKKKASNGAVHDINGTCMISWGGGGTRGKRTQTEGSSGRRLAGVLRKSAPQPAGAGCSLEIAEAGGLRTQVCIQLPICSTWSAPVPSILCLSCRRP